MSFFKDSLRLLYIVHLLYIVYIMSHILFSDDSFYICSNIFVELFQLLIIADNYHCHLTIVHYSNAGNELQAFRSCYKKTTRQL